MKQFECLLYDVADNIATVTLNRPQARNSLNQQLRFELRDAISLASGDEDVRIVIVTGAGKGFCAGADLNESLEGFGTTGFITRQLKYEYHLFMQAIMDCPKPVICAVNGAAAGIGGSLAMISDLTVMAEDAFIYSAFGAIALIPDGGNHYLLHSALGYKKAYQMILESDRLTAQQCLELGLTNKVVPADQLLSATREWALQLKNKAPLAMMYSKKVLRSLPGMSIEECMNMEAELQDICILSEDFKEGTSAFFEKRTAEFKGK